MSIKNIVIAGCSYSDWANVEYNYGEYLGQNLNLPVKSYSSGCGSNYRIWRKLVSSIISKEITKNDLLIIQYTNPDRREFWSVHKSPNKADYLPIGNSLKGSLMRDSYDEGDLIKYKVGAGSWQPLSLEKTFFNLYENNFMSEMYDIEIFNTNHFMFQSLLKEFNIPAIFLLTGYTHTIENMPRLECNFHHYLDVKHLQVKSLCLEDYCAHLNDTGHKELAKTISEFIKTNIF